MHDLCKFADDKTCKGSSSYNNDDTDIAEVKNIKPWSDKNRMMLHIDTTYEMIARGKTSVPPPCGILFIKQKTWLKILGVTVEKML